MQTIGKQYDRLDCCEWILAKHPDILSSEASESITIRSSACCTLNSASQQKQAAGRSLSPNYKTRL